MADEQAHRRRIGPALAELRDRAREYRAVDVGHQSVGFGQRQHLARGMHRVVAVGQPQRGLELRFLAAVDRDHGLEREAQAVVGDRLAQQRQQAVVACVLHRRFVHGDAVWRAARFAQGFHRMVEQLVGLAAGTGGVAHRRAQALRRAGDLDGVAADAVAQPPRQAFERWIVRGRGEHREHVVVEARGGGLADQRGEAAAGLVHQVLEAGEAVAVAQRAGILDFHAQRAAAVGGMRGDALHQFRAMQQAGRRMPVVAAAALVGARRARAAPGSAPPRSGAAAGSAC